MTLKDRLESLVWLGKFLEQPSEEFEAVKHKARMENLWFTAESVEKAIEGIKIWLTKDALESWLSNYSICDTKAVRTGLILAGNIPLVGFHDIMTNYIAGNVSVIKFSEKDKVLIPFLLEVLKEGFPQAAVYFDFDGDFKNIDQLIATGSDNSAKLFKSYFSHVPSLIRCHRNAVAILTGNETDEELLALGEDVFSYYGLGCRNVSKLYVPQEYSFDRLLTIWHDKYKDMVLLDKYKNNFDYLYAIYLLNKEAFFANGHVILRESKDLSSPVASLFYEHYDNIELLAETLQSLTDRLQVIVSTVPIGELGYVKPGQAQQPAINDYADGVDTLEFLLK